MGWAIVERNLGRGAYVVTHDNGDFNLCWCADRTADIPVGTKVGTITVARNLTFDDYRLIKPGRCRWQNCKWNRKTDGEVKQAGDIRTPAAALLAKIFDTGAKYWRPLYVFGSVQSVNVEGNQAYVASAGWGNQSFQTWLPVEYMSQNAAVLDVADEVVVKLVNGVPVKVIGFKSSPKDDSENEDDASCTSECYGEPDCACCTDPTGDACIAFCDANPDHPTCKCIADPTEANCKTVCTRCSTLRAIYCAAAGEGAAGCECVDNPGLAICAACSDYCELNADPVVCDPCTTARLNESLSLAKTTADKTEVLKNCLPDFDYVAGKAVISYAYVNSSYTKTYCYAISQPTHTSYDYQFVQFFASVNFYLYGFFDSVVTPSPVFDVYDTTAGRKYSFDDIPDGASIYAVGFKTPQPATIVEIPVPTGAPVDIDISDKIRIFLADGVCSAAVITKYPAHFANQSLIGCFFNPTLGISTINFSYDVPKNDLHLFEFSVVKSSAYIAFTVASINSYMYTLPYGVETQNSCTRNKPALDESKKLLKKCLALISPHIPKSTDFFAVTSKGLYIALKSNGYCDSVYTSCTVCTSPTSNYYQSAILTYLRNIPIAAAINGADIPPLGCSSFDALIPPNIPPTGAVTITGKNIEGETLTATNTLADENGIGAITYTWSTGTTGATYVIQTGDIGSAITVTASYTDGDGYAESVTSEPTEIIVEAADSPVTGTVTIATLSDGKTWGVTNTLTDPDGTASITYQWQRSDGAGFVNIADATADQYKPTKDDVGHTIKCCAKHTDGNGVVETICSDASRELTADDKQDEPVVFLEISDKSPQQGDQLTANWEIDDPAGYNQPSFAWSWSGGSSESIPLTLEQIHVGKVINLTMTHIDGNGKTIVTVATPTAAVTNVNDEPVGTLTLSGTPQEDAYITATLDIVDEDGMGDVDYNWTIDGSDYITGSRIILIGQDAVGKMVGCYATYTDQFGADERIESSNEIGPIENVNDPLLGDVKALHYYYGDDGIVYDDESYIPIEGDSYEAVTELLVDDDGIKTIAYQWERSFDGINWQPFVGESSGDTFTLPFDSITQYVRVMVGVVDNYGGYEVKVSNVAGPVHNIASEPTGRPQIHGTVVVGNTLTATSHLVEDDDGVFDVVYRWYATSSDSLYSRDDYMTDIASGGNAVFVHLGDTYVAANYLERDQFFVAAVYRGLDGAEDMAFSELTPKLSTSNTEPTGSVTVEAAWPAPTNTDLHYPGNSISATNDIVDADGFYRVSYDWERAPVNEQGWFLSCGYGEQYDITTEDAYSYIRAVASYVDNGGTTERIYSDAVQVAGVPDGLMVDTNIGLSGDAAVDRYMSISVFVEGDYDDFVFYWQTDDGITLSSNEIRLKLTADMIGKRIRGGAARRVNDIITQYASTDWSDVITDNKVPFGTVFISLSGAPYAVMPVTGVFVRIFDPNGLSDTIGTVRAIWQRSDEGLAWETVITEAPQGINLSPVDGPEFDYMLDGQSSVIITEDWVGKHIRFGLEFVDNSGNTNRIYSNATAKTELLPVT